MYHGEDLAKAGAAPATLGSGAIGQAVNLGARGGGNLASARSTTIQVLVSQAIDTTNYARDRLESLEALSSRALTLATRLTGSFPAPATDRAGLVAGEKERPPGAALEEVGRCIGDIRRPLAAMDDPFQRLVVALNAIEEALS